MTRALALALLLASGCAEDPVRFRVVALTDPDPYLGADRVAVALEREGEPIQSTEQLFDPGAAEWRLDGLPYAADLRLRVEARAGDLVLARGRSFPFDTIEGAPETWADVSLGALGRFGRVLDAPPEDPPRAVVPVEGGAMWADAAGRVVRFVAHGPDGHALREVIGVGPDGASWSGIAELGLIAIASDTATLFGSDGQIAARASHPALAELGAEPTLVPLSDGVFAIGGAASSSVLRLRVADGALDVTQLPELPAGAVRGCAFTLTSEQARVVAVGPDGGWVIHPETGTAEPLPAPAYPAGAAVVPLQRGLVAIVGGEIAGGVVDTVTLLVLRSDSVQQLDAQPLYQARRDAAVVPLREGLALIAGGVGASGALGSAELLERTLGEVSPTGEMPAPSASPVGAVLDDGSVLVVGDEGVSVYFVPR